MTTLRSLRPRSLIISIVTTLASAALAIVFFSSTTPTVVHASPTDNMQGAAWSSNIGWINLNGPTYGVSMAMTGDVRNLNGYGWSSNIGWVSFNGAETGGCPSGTCQARVEWGASGGPAVQVKGWARACSVFANSATGGCSGALVDTTKPGSQGGWDGFISLGDSKTTDAVNFGVKINTTTGVASGYAWGSEVVGWVDFSGVKTVVTGDPSMCPDGVTPLVPGPCPHNSSNYCPDNTTLIPPGGLSQCPSGTTYCPDGVTALPGPCPTNGTEICGNNIDDNNNGLTDEGCGTNPGGICPNIPVGIQQSLIASNKLTFPPYRKVLNNDGTTNKCLCVAGYVLNAKFECVKPVYTEH